MITYKYKLQPMSLNENIESILDIYNDISNFGDIIDILSYLGNNRALDKKDTESVTLLPMNIITYLLKNNKRKSQQILSYYQNIFYLYDIKPENMMIMISDLYDNISHSNNNNTEYILLYTISSYVFCCDNKYDINDVICNFCEKFNIESEVVYKFITETYIKFLSRVENTRITINPKILDIIMPKSSFIKIIYANEYFFNDIIDYLYNYFKTHKMAVYKNTKTTYNELNRYISIMIRRMKPLLKKNYYKEYGLDLADVEEKYKIKSLYHAERLIQFIELLNFVLINKRYRNLGFIKVINLIEAIDIYSLEKRSPELANRLSSLKIYNMIILYNI
ncbi:hypothetical protein FPHOBKDP_00024 [Listeria phage LPJP1]|nr:hypothetical protein FPHOBKDP_00024 [Listeria phage LPJP1]